VAVVDPPICDLDRSGPCVHAVTCRLCLGRHRAARAPDETAGL